MQVLTCCFASSLAFGLITLSILIITEMYLLLCKICTSHNRVAWSDCWIYHVVISITCTWQCYVQSEHTFGAIASSLYSTLIRKHYSYLRLIALLVHLFFYVSDGCFATFSILQANVINNLESINSCKLFSHL